MRGESAGFAAVRELREDSTPPKFRATGFAGGLPVPPGAAWRTYCA